jgi:hypothetical protein
VMVERTPVGIEDNGALLWKDRRHHCDWKHTPTPEKDAVLTDRDSFTAGAHELDECPYSSSARLQDRVSLGCGEQFANPPSIAPARRRRRTHKHNIAKVGPRGRSVKSQDVDVIGLCPDR